MSHKKSEVHKKLAMSYHSDPAHNEASARFDRAMAAMEAKFPRDSNQSRGTGVHLEHLIGGGGGATSSTPNLLRQQPQPVVPPLDFSKASMRDASVSPQQPGNVIFSKASRRDASPSQPTQQYYQHQSASPQQPGGSQQQNNYVRALDQEKSDIFKRSLDALERERASLVRYSGGLSDRHQMVSGEFGTGPQHLSQAQHRTAPHNDGLAASTLNRGMLKSDKTGGLRSEDPFSSNPVFGNISDLQQKRVMQVQNFRDGEEDRLFPFQFDVSKERDTHKVGEGEGGAEIESGAGGFRQDQVDEPQQTHQGGGIGQSVSPPQGLAALQRSPPGAPNWREMFYEVNHELTKVRTDLSDMETEKVQLEKQLEQIVDENVSGMKNNIEYKSQCAVFKTQLETERNGRKRDEEKSKERETELLAHIERLKMTISDTGSNTMDIVQRCETLEKESDATTEKWEKCQNVVKQVKSGIGIPLQNAIDLCDTYAGADHISRPISDVFAELSRRFAKILSKLEGVSNEDPRAMGLVGAATIVLSEAFLVVIKELHRTRGDMASARREVLPQQQVPAKQHPRTFSPAPRARSPQAPIPTMTKGLNMQSSPSLIRSEPVERPRSPKSNAFGRSIHHKPLPQAQVPRSRRANHSIHVDQDYQHEQMYQI